MSVAKRVFKNSIFLYCKIAITSICLLLSTRFVLKGLGIQDFGIYNLICSTIIMLGFLNDSMTVATQRFMSYSEGEGNLEKSIKIFNSSFVVHIIIAIIIGLTFTILTPIIFGDYLQIPNERKMAAMVVYFFMILTTCINITTVPYNAVLIAHENMLYFSIIGSLNGILKLLVTICIQYIQTDRLIAYGFFMLLVAIFDITILKIYCSKKYSECVISLRKNYEKKILKEILSFAGWQMTYSASSIISIQGMSLILNSFYGTIMNAAQGIARQVCGQMMTLSSTMTNTLNPIIIKKAGAKEQKNMVHTVIIGSKLSYFLVIIVALPIMFELPYLLNIWLTEVPEYAIQFCRWEVIQQIIASLTMVLVTMISGVGDIKAFQIFSALTYIIRLPFIFVVLYFCNIPVYAYYVTTIAVILLCVGRVYYAHKKCSLPILSYLKKVIFPCIIVTLSMVLVIFIIVNNMHQSLIRLIVTICSSTFTFFISTYFIALNKEERSLLTSFIKSFSLKTIYRRHER